MKRRLRSCMAWIASHKMLLASILLCVAVVAFIFSNSLENAEKSHISSGRFVRLLKPLLDPHDRIDATTFSTFVRKLAHFTEFFWLGMALCGIIRSTGCGEKQATSSSNRPNVAAGLLFALLTAVTDEWIQSYTGRTSSVRDVILDFFGALCGLLFATLVWYGVACVRRGMARKRRHKS